MTIRKPGHILGISAHPTRSWVPDIPGHKQRENVIRGKTQIESLEERTKKLREEILGIEKTGDSENKG